MDVREKVTSKKNKTMTEIKFKVWDKKEGVMSEGLPLDWFITGDHTDMEFPATDSTLPLTDFRQYLTDFVFMQFIGLKDSDGVEIYEGDIVQAGGSMVFSNPNVTAGQIREIFFHKSGFTGVRVGNGFDKEHCNSGDNWNNYTLWNVQRDLKIIGNIHNTEGVLERK